ncbi:hypothetical protein KEJ18_04945 [Candidatus Bathyarchaeota archaeon]|nr:hypothetical protein [Candidatus Bathyarchaeota archaeon]
MDEKIKSKPEKLLLMGSSAFSAKELPAEIKERVDEAIDNGVTVIVGEAYGACRLFQDYLALKGYRNVVVGHAVKIRYNVGNWKDFQYGRNLRERERRMIEDCDFAIVIWMNNSGVIAENLELLKRLRKPTFLFECSSETGIVKAGEIDIERTYDPFYYMKEHYRKLKRQK